MKKLLLLLILLGCQSPVAVQPHQRYYIRLNKHIDSVSASVPYLEISATTNIPGMAWAITDGVRDTVITQQGVNYGYVYWYAAVNPVNEYSSLGGHLEGGHFVGDIIGPVTTRYGVYITPEANKTIVDTVIAYAYMSDVYIADTMQIVIYNRR